MICTREKCLEVNPFYNRFCSKCGFSLESSSTYATSWSMVGGTPKRQFKYQMVNPPGWGSEPPHPLDRQFYLQNSRPNRRNEPVPRPLPIMAFNTIWQWNQRERILCGIPLDNRSGQKTASRLVFGDPLEGKQILGQGPPDFSSTPAFDGVFLNFIREGLFYRISNLNASMTEAHLGEERFAPGVAAAPMCVGIPYPDRPNLLKRFFIQPLRGMVVVIDISTFGADRAQIVPWSSPQGEEDELRSPVYHDRNVYLVSKMGGVWRLPLSREGVKGDLESALVEVARVEEVLCYAPIIVDGHLVFETVNREKALAGGRKRFIRRLIAIDLETEEMVFNEKLSLNVHAREFERYGHLGGFSDGRQAYFFTTLRTGRFAGWSPQKGLMKRKLEWAEEGSPPPVSINNGLICQGEEGDSRLLIYHYEMGSVFGFDLPSGEYVGQVEAMGVPRLDKKDQFIYSPPIMFANMMVLPLIRHLAFGIIN